MRYAVLLVVLLGAVGCEKPRPAPTQPADDTPKQVVPPPKIHPAPKPKDAEPKPSGGVSTKPKAEEIPRRPLTKDEQFEADCLAAVVLCRELDRAEPDDTARALKLLTRGERADAEGRIGLSKGYDPGPHAATLRRYGLTAAADRECRRVALADKSFKAVARAFWEYDPGPDRIVAMMHGWGSLDPSERPVVVYVVSNKLSADQLLPSMRDVVLIAGGRKWLEAR